MVQLSPLDCMVIREFLVQISGLYDSTSEKVGIRSGPELRCMFIPAINYLAVVACGAWYVIQQTS